MKAVVEIRGDHGVKKTKLGNVITYKFTDEHLIIRGEYFTQYFQKQLVLSMFVEESNLKSVK